MLRALSALPLLALALSACGGSGGGNWEITDQPLQGVINGEAWTFASGETDSFLDDEDDFFGSLYGETSEACGFGSPDTPYILASIPREVGEYTLGLMQNITFVTGPGENLIATNGGLIVDEVTATTVSGGLVAKFDSDNEVDGNFTLTICTE